jgi:hypothetical protein
VVSSVPRLHFTPGIDPVPIVQEAVWAPGLVWMGGKSRLHQDSILDRPACSQSLYQLSYLAHTHTHTYIYIYMYCTGMCVYCVDMYANCIKCMYTKFTVVMLKVSMYTISMDVHYVG